jgi:hypothetical protein
MILLTKTGNNMPKNSFRYPFGIRIAKTGSAFMEGILSLIFIVLLWLIIFQPDQIKQEPIRFLLLILLVPFGSIFLAYFAYSFSEIKLDTDSIYLEFLWYWIKIPWNEVVSIEDKEAQLSYKPIFKEHIVRVKKLTLFHNLYGLMYLMKFTPCFVINAKISHYNEIVKEIKRHI